ncbi:MAG: HAD-IC family P-type ATPase [Thermodesulfobacteriota bacterium]
MVEAIHTAVAGRARYRVEGLRRSEALKRLLEFRLSQNRDITCVSASALTGNILVCFNSDNTPQSIAAIIEEIVVEYRNYSNNSSTQSEGAPVNFEETVPDRGYLDFLPGFRDLFYYAAAQPQEPWHLLKAEEVLARFHSDRALGLTWDAAREHIKTYGPNVLPEAEARSGWEIFLGQFNSLPVALLGAAAGLSVLTGGLVDALLIMGVVTINAFIGYKTESEAEKTIESLKTLVRPSALVVRAGRMSEVPAEEVAIGDLLVLRPGIYVAADARLLEASHLSLDESALTGESLPVTKTTEALTSPNIPLGDRVNLVFRGTLVTGGEGLAVVAATGGHTEIGRIQALMGETESPETPLQRQLGRLGDQLVVICMGVCGLTFIVGSFWGMGFVQMLRTSICLAAAAVPEGLPMVATTTMALGVRDMRQHHVLIRHLQAVETLGSVQTVCLDKTGTITRNQMSVVEVFIDRQSLKVSNGRFWGPEGQIVPAQAPELQQLLLVSILCNETELYQDNGREVFRGTPTENALVRLALDAGLDVAALRREYPLLLMNHRSETRLFMGSQHQHGAQETFLALKGSPMDILALCDRQMRNGREAPLTEEDRSVIEMQNEDMAGRALRILGIAYAVRKNGQGPTDETGLTWVGMMGMTDPIREGVAGAIQDFHQAGIDTVMITGDQSTTAYAIGQELSLSQGAPLEILDATYLAHIEPEALRALAKRAKVFSRVSPAHKLQIVQALQQAGKVVAMTGDGINDGPALKAADVGIAMGRTGTDVAREVADVVLEKDNLDTMIVAIRDGRTIYLNIRKSVHFFLATNLSEIMLTFTALSVGLGSPLNAMQLLWINLISDIFPGLALALEPPEPDVLERQPRDPQAPIFDTADYQRMAFESGSLAAGALGAYGYGIMRYGLGAQAGTLAFHSLTAGQLLHALSCRSEHQSMFTATKPPVNRYLTLALGGSLALQLGTAIIPGLRSILGLTPLTLIDGLVIGSGALLPFLVNEATKPVTETKTETKAQIIPLKGT